MVLRTLLLASGMMLSLVSLPGSAQAESTLAVVPCAFSAWSHDNDPGGVNIRSAPSRTARIVATLPKLKSGYGVEFRVVGTSGGWFLIEGAEDPDYDQTGAREISKARGWIFGRLVESSVASVELRTQPRSDATVILTMSGTHEGSSYGPDSIPVRRILSCKGSWTQVQVEDPPTRRPYTGWVERMCGNQVTTCP